MKLSILGASACMLVTGASADVTTNLEKLSDSTRAMLADPNISDENFYGGAILEDKLGVFGIRVVEKTPDASKLQITQAYKDGELVVINLEVSSTKAGVEWVIRNCSATTHEGLGRIGDMSEIKDLTGGNSCNLSPQDEAALFADTLGTICAFKTDFRTRSCA